MRTKRSATAFALGERIGVLSISMSSLRKVVSKSSVNLLSRSRIRKRTGVARSGKVQVSWRACWVTRRAVLRRSGVVLRKIGELIGEHSRNEPDALARRRPSLRSAEPDPARALGCARVAAASPRRAAGAARWEAPSWSLIPGAGLCESSRPPRQRQIDSSSVLCVRVVRSASPNTSAKRKGLCARCVPLRRRDREEAVRGVRVWRRDREERDRPPR